MAFTPVAITGTFTRPDGTAQTGTGTATLSHRLVNGTTEIEPTPIQFQLNAAGQVVNMIGLALILDAVDDAGTSPPGAFYTFALSFDSAPLDAFQAVVSSAGKRTDAACATTINNATVVDAAVGSGDVGRSVSGPGVQPGSAILSVTAGVSFVMNLPALASGTGLSLLLGPVVDLSSLIPALP